MSTFFGGEQLEQLQFLEVLGGNLSSYTIPSGRYAIVEYAAKKNSTSGSALVTARTPTNETYFVDERQNVSTTQMQGTVHMEAGDIFQITATSVGGGTGGFAGKAVIKLYKLP
jgi:hypothetical protein